MKTVSVRGNMVKFIIWCNMPCSGVIGHDTDSKRCSELVGFIMLSSWGGEEPLQGQFQGPLIPPHWQALREKNFELMKDNRVLDMLNLIARGTSRWRCLVSVVSLAIGIEVEVYSVLLLSTIVAWSSLFTERFSFRQNWNLWLHFGKESQDEPVCANLNFLSIRDIGEGGAQGMIKSFLVVRNAFSRESDN